LINPETACDVPILALNEDLPVFKLRLGEIALVAYLLAIARAC
jgi:hypothetical protein